MPRGFLHGFLTLTPDTQVIYKVDNPYDAASDGGVLWSDPDLGIDWGVAPDGVTLSDKDRRAAAVPRLDVALRVRSECMRLLVTGGAGFIGSAVVRQAIADGHEVVNLDALTYAANLPNLRQRRRPATATPSSRPTSATGRRSTAIFATHQPDAVMHLAAESHVDRSIDGPAAFIDTNVAGTFTLLEAARAYWGGDAATSASTTSRPTRCSARWATTGQFTETTPYAPNSPYSASKAASDHLVRAWHETYGLPVVLSNCSNNYGPFHFPEKLIPVVILNALHGQAIPVYGEGENVRDWLYVEDHADGAPCGGCSAGGSARATTSAATPRRGTSTSSRGICALLDEMAPGRARRTRG